MWKNKDGPERRPTAENRTGKHDRWSYEKIEGNGASFGLNRKMLSEIR